MPIFSEYKDIFGAPGTGVHSHRTLGMATVDLFATVGAAGLVSWYFDYSFLYVLIVLLVIGIIVHYLFGVNTALNVAIFGETKDLNFSGNHSNNL